MDFSVRTDPPEIGDFRKEVREWLQENMRGSEHLRWSAGWSTRDNEEEYQFRRELGRKLGRKGWLFPVFPVAYGGAGLTIDHHVVLDTELDRYGLNLGHVFYTDSAAKTPLFFQVHFSSEGVFPL